MKTLVSILFVLASTFAQADRIKDITSVAGVRSNQLVGYGLVVGLEGTGDKTAFTSQTFRNMLNNFGVVIPPNVNPSSKNIAAVAIHAELPPSSKPGQAIDPENHQYGTIVLIIAELLRHGMRPHPTKAAEKIAASARDVWKVFPVVFTAAG